MAQTTIPKLLFTTVWSSAKGTFSINANSGVNVFNGGYTELPTAPDGYKLITWWIRINGNSGVIPSGIETGWVQNTTNSNLTGLSAQAVGLFYKG